MEQFPENESDSKLGKPVSYISTEKVDNTKQ